MSDKSKPQHNPVDLIKDINDFYMQFGLPQQQRPSIPDSQKELIKFRCSLLQEELDELNDAVKNKKIDDALDALVDIIYVALGTAWLFNLPFEKAWVEVHNANMEKTHGKTQRHFQDAIKPKGWKRPDIQKVINEYDCFLDEQEKLKTQFLKGG